MQNDLVSVIIPAYNSEQYITKCIESVINQTYKNIEIIVVNDGSSDSTVSVVKKFRNVILLNKENGGSSSARNYGIKYAKGKYVIFLDSDDYLDSDYIFTLLEKSSGKADELITCNISCDRTMVKTRQPERVIVGRNNIYDAYLHGTIYNSSVNKLYPLGMIKNVVFPEGRDLLEDVFFTSHILEFCNTIIDLQYSGYNYVRHPDSLSKKRHTRKEAAGKWSNILEKDLMLSRFISISEYRYGVIQVIKNIKIVLLSSCDINLFDISNKIIELLRFAYKNKNLLEDKHLVSFIDHLRIPSNTNQLRKRFVSFVLLKDSLSSKIQLIRSAIIKLLKLH